MAVYHDHLSCEHPCLSVMCVFVVFFFFSSRRRHTRCLSDWSSDVCSSDLDWGATICLHADHLGAFSFIDPAQFLHFLERLPHADQPDASSGWVKNGVWQLPSHLFGHLVAHGFLAFDAERFLQGRDIEPAFLLFALGNHSPAI